MSVEVKALDSDRSPIIGISLIAARQVDGVTHGSIVIGEETIEVPLRFYKGNLNTVRAELYSIVDEAIDTLMQ